MKDGEEKKGASGGECYGDYDSTTRIGTGAGFVNSCVHSGSSTYSGGSTVWYNYAAATAGSIRSSSNTDTIGTTVTATESLCPKGWTLPNEKQAIGNTVLANFNPVLGGEYNNGSSAAEANAGYWWESEMNNGTIRRVLYYRGDSLFTNNGIRSTGIYIRCVSEEKDVSDLTYMQDMTPSMTTRAAWNLCPK